MDILTSNVQVWQVIAIAIGWWIAGLIIYALKAMFPGEIEADNEYETKLCSNNRRDMFMGWMLAIERRQVDTSQRLDELEQLVVTNERFDELEQLVVTIDGNFDDLFSLVEWNAQPWWKRKLIELLDDDE